MLSYPPRSKEDLEILPARLRTALRARGVSYIQVTYCALDGILFASLSACRRESDTRRIHLPCHMRKALRRLFERQMFVTHPTWLGGSDCAGIFQWNLRIGSSSHKHFGYRQQFFSTDEVATVVANLNKDQRFTG